MTRLHDSAARVAATSVAIKTAEALRGIGDAISAAGARVDAVGEAVRDRGHALLDAWANRCELRDARRRRQIVAELARVQREVLQWQLEIMGRQRSAEQWLPLVAREPSRAEPLSRSTARDDLGAAGLGGVARTPPGG